MLDIEEGETFTIATKLPNVTKIVWEAIVVSDPVYDEESESWSYTVKVQQPEIVTNETKEEIPKN